MNTLQRRLLVAYIMSTDLRLFKGGSEELPVRKIAGIISSKSGINIAPSTISKNLPRYVVDGHPTDLAKKEFLTYLRDCGRKFLEYFLTDDIHIVKDEIPVARILHNEWLPLMRHLENLDGRTLGPLDLPWGVKIKKDSYIVSVRGPERWETKCTWWLILLAMDELTESRKQEIRRSLGLPESLELTQDDLNLISFIRSEFESEE